MSAQKNFHHNPLLNNMKQFIIALCFLAVFLCCLGCSTILYCSCQAQGRDERAQSNELPFGNITRGDMEVWKDTWTMEDDVLPNWLHRSLNTVCVLIDMPISLAFDIVTFPWQYCCHRRYWKQEEDE